MAELGAEGPSDGVRRTFSAVHRLDGREITISLWPAPPDGPDHSALEARVERLRELRHHAIDAPVAVGDVDGCAWIAEEASSSAPAAERVEAGPLPITDAVSAIRDVARVLAALHRAGLTHGAIDLETVRIGVDGARVIGAARSLGTSVRDDLDALATVAWALLAGERKVTPGLPLSKLRRSVPHVLDALLSAMRHPDPRQRPHRAEVVLRMLDPIPARCTPSPRTVVDPPAGGASRRGRRMDLGAGSWE